MTEEAAASDGRDEDGDDLEAEGGEEEEAAHLFRNADPVAIRVAGSEFLASFGESHEDGACDESSGGSQVGGPGGELVLVIVS